MSKPILVKEKYPKSLPHWVKVDSYELHENGTATIEVWGYRFENIQVTYDSGDRFEHPTYSTVLKHPTGDNWLKAFWFTAYK